MKYSLLPRSTLLVLPLIGLSTQWAVAAEPNWPPAGQAQRVELSADLYVSTAKDEERGNNGGSSRLKLKGNQEFTLLNAAFAPLKGRLISGALLHLKCVTPEVPARRVSISTIATPWLEGRGKLYEQQHGSACFESPALGERFWAYQGSSLMDVIMGKGGTIWRFADASAPDKEGWQSIAIEPDVVAANIAGLSHGLALQDDVGNEWSLIGDKFDYRLFPNRYFASREQHVAAPWLEIWSSGEDHEAPEAITAIHSEVKSLPAGQVLLKWRTPPDRGGGHTLGFQVSYDVGRGSTNVPRHLIPMAGEHGSEVRMLLQELNLPPGATLRLQISAVDSAGNVSTPFTCSVKLSQEIVKVDLSPAHATAITHADEKHLAPAVLSLPQLQATGDTLEPFAPEGELPQIAGIKVAILDQCDKVEALTGKLLPPQPQGYLRGNHLWSAAQRLIRLQAARNETISFIINLEGKSPAVTAELLFPPASGVETALYRLDFVKSKKPTAIVPDAAVPLSSPFSIPPADDPEATEATNLSLLGELYLPHTLSAGLKKGKLILSAAREKLELDVALNVWDFTLPNKLSFVPEMNCYGTANPTTNLEYYRMAHRHRTCLNRLYYSWRCQINDGAAPEIQEGRYDWSAFDRDFAPLFNGSAFHDLPRKGEPLDLFYLPINENWPALLKPHYSPSYWADTAFDNAYSDAIRNAGAEFARHFNEKKWNETIFQFFLNNKIFFKIGYPFDSIPAPWVFDEPVNLQDFWALRWYSLLFKQGIAQQPGTAKLWVRADVSRSQFSRQVLWGVMDIEVMGGVTAQKIRMKRDEAALHGSAPFTEYGDASDLGASNLHQLIWSLSAWSHGSRGVLPWQTIATAKAWQEGESTGLFYPSPKGPIASIRLKGFTRAQQDIEYLTLLSHLLQISQRAVAAGAAQFLADGEAPVLTQEQLLNPLFAKANTISLWRLRTIVGSFISARHPPYAREINPWPEMKPNLTALPKLGYVSVAPPVSPAAPEMRR